MHFAVTIIGDNPEKQLEPYKENTGGDKGQYDEWVSEEEEYREEYEIDIMAMVIMADGTMYPKSDRRFYQPVEGSIFKSEFRLPEGAEVVDEPLTTVYSDFDDYMVRHCNGKRGGPDNTYGYWQNPNRKWDWYTLGGRWSGMLLAKNGCAGTHGQAGLGTPDRRAGYYDQLRKGDIDLDQMKLNAEEDARKNWDLAEGQSEVERHFVYGIGKGKTLEEYVAHARHFSTFAFLMNGEWHERGSDAPESVEEWQAKFDSLLAQVDDDAMVSIYDCHI